MHSTGAGWRTLTGDPCVMHLVVTSLQIRPSLLLTPSHICVALEILCLRLPAHIDVSRSTTGPLILALVQALHAVGLPAQIVGVKRLGNLSD